MPDRNERELHTGAAQAGQAPGTQPQQGLGGGGGGGGKSGGGEVKMRPLSPCIPAPIAHEDHVKILVAEAQADEEYKFATNRADVEGALATEQTVADALKKSKMVPPVYPQMDFSNNDQLREASTKEMKAEADVKAKEKALKAQLEVQKKRDKAQVKRMFGEAPA